jgi:hypothetical protein
MDSIINTEQRRSAFVVDETEEFVPSQRISGRVWEGLMDYYYEASSEPSLYECLDRIQMLTERLFTNREEMLHPIVELSRMMGGNLSLTRKDLKATIETREIEEKMQEEEILFSLRNATIDLYEQLLDPIGSKEVKEHVESLRMSFPVQSIEEILDGRDLHIGPLLDSYVLSHPEIKDLTGEQKMEFLLKDEEFLSKNRLEVDSSASIYRELFIEGHKNLENKIDAAFQDELKIHQECEPSLSLTCYKQQIARLKESRKQTLTAQRSDSVSTAVQLAVYLLALYLIYKLAKEVFSALEQQGKAPQRAPNPKLSKKSKKI